MEKKEYLDEKKYKRTSNIFLFMGIGFMLVAAVVLLVALFPMISGKEEALSRQLEQLRPGLEERYAELEAMGAEESTDYKDKEGFEMEQIGIALNPKYKYCEQVSTYAKNDTTREYCDIKSQIYDINEPFRKIVGALFVVLPCFGIGLALLIFAKRRNMMAYGIQQVMPVAQEAVEKMTPTIAKSAGRVAKGVKEGMTEKAESDKEPEKKEDA